MIEVTTFRLIDDANADAYKDIDARLQTEFFYQQPGLVRRTTARSDDGTWVTIVVWSDLAAAQLAVTKSFGRKEFSEALALIDSQSIEMRRYDTL
jgi:hypothetical protein